MKYKSISVSLMSALLIGLAGCGTGQPAQTSGQTQQSQTPATTNGDSSSTSSNSSTGQGSSTGTNTGSSSSSNSSSSSSTSSNQDQTSSQSNQSSSTSDNQQSTAPTTEKQALKDIADALSTKVPLILPTEVPLGSAKYLTGTTTSEKWYYKAELFGTNRPEKINSDAASNGTLIATVEGTEYASDAKAQEQINGYMQVDPNNENAIDLGDGIKGVMEAATGHGFIIWNEGRWCIRIDSPNDKTYQSKEYSDSKKFAETVVSYLHDHYLPAPEKMGLITIRLWQNSTDATVQWQYHQMVYQVTSNNPLDAVKVATSMKFVS